MARKVGQIIARGERRWLIRFYLGRDHQTNKRKYHNRTIHGSMREAQAYLIRKLRERDLGRLEGAKITLNEYLDRWLEIAVKPQVREKTCQDYDDMMQRYIRPYLGDRVLAAVRPRGRSNYLSKMIERGLSARTVRYTYATFKVCDPAGCRCPGRPLRGSRELHCPRDNSHRTEPAAHSGRENLVIN